MILEGVITTLDERQTLNVAPMGPVVDASMSSMLLRPFNTSRTYQNLKRCPQAVFHVVDDVLLISRSAIDRLEGPPETFAAQCVEGRVLADACRWYELKIVDCDDSRERCALRALVVHTGRLRDFFGFNRAKHAVLEAAILATRLHLLPTEQVIGEFRRLAVPVQKTAGPRELEAFDLLRGYVAERLGVAP
jgi:hypothetical protein